MITEEFSLRSPQGHGLAATNVLNIDGDPPVALILHGMHEHGRQIFRKLSEQLAAQNIGALRFDFTGVKDSPGSLANQTLQDKRGEALAALRCFEQGRARMIIGHSMGAQVAASMLDITSPEALLLFAPMAYSASLENTPIDDGFFIRSKSPGSWRDSLTFERLKNYKGRVLLVAGDQDELIPPGMIDAFEAACSNASFEKMIIPGAPHGLQGWLQQPENGGDRQQVLEKIAALIQ